MRRSSLILILVAVAFVAFLFGAGVLYFRHDDNSSSIHVDTDRVKEGTQKVVDKTEEVGEKIVDETKEAVDRVDVDVDMDAKPAGDST